MATLAALHIVQPEWRNNYFAAGGRFSGGPPSPTLTAPGLHAADQRNTPVARGGPAATISTAAAEWKIKHGSLMVLIPI